MIWGSSFFFIAIGNTAFPPIGLGFWRCLLGALILYTIMLFRGLKLPKNPKFFLLTFALGTFNTAIPFALFSFGEHHVSSAFAGMANAITPVATVIALLTVFRGEKVTRNQILGLFIGVVGVLTLIGVWDGVKTDNWLGVLAVVIGASCYGFGGPFIRRFIQPMNQPYEVAAFGQIAGAAVVLAPFYFSQPLTTGPITVQAIGAVMVLGMFGTAIAYILYYPLLKQVGSAVSSSVTLLTPLIAVSLGVIILHEQLKWHEPVGGLIILLGAAVAQGLFRRRKTQTV